MIFLEYVLQKQQTLSTKKIQMVQRKLKAINLLNSSFEVIISQFFEIGSFHILKSVQNSRQNSVIRIRGIPIRMHHWEAKLRFIVQLLWRTATALSYFSLLIVYVRFVWNSENNVDHKMWNHKGIFKCKKNNCSLCHEAWMPNVSKQKDILIC